MIKPQQTAQWLHSGTAKCHIQLCGNCSALNETDWDSRYTVLAARELQQIIRLPTTADLTIIAESENIPDKIQCKTLKWNFHNRTVAQIDLVIG
jgi:hypothetical protein